MGMYVIKNDETVNDLSENIEKGLRYIGKAMQCVDDMKRSCMSQEKNRYPMYPMNQMMGGYPVYPEGMSGERRWSNQYGHGYSGRRDNEIPGHMPPPVDPMYM